MQKQKTGGTPRWVDAHSVTCHFCGRLADERETVDLHTTMPDRFEAGEAHEACFHDWQERQDGTDRKTVHRPIEYLESRGFDYLTAEADPLGLRLLMDLSPEAQQIFCRWSGVSDVEFADPYNHSLPWGSVMIPRASLRDLTIFVLIAHDGHAYVAEIDDVLYAGASSKQCRELLRRARERRARIGRVVSPTRR